jgi:hypothetical protein
VGLNADLYIAGALAVKANRFLLPDLFVGNQARMTAPLKRALAASRAGFGLLARLYLLSWLCNDRETGSALLTGVIAMAINTLGSSDHFVYQWDDTVNGSQQRATALQASCEEDLSRLESLFNEFHGFDSNQVTLIAGNPRGGLAVNNGFHSDGTTSITVTAWPGVTPAATADAGARLEFIAEMSEVMMSLRNARRGSRSWNPAGSNGKTRSVTRRKVKNNRLAAAGYTWASPR